jgi:hypothetical protein
MTTQPTPDQVRNAKLAARLARPAAPVAECDIEAARSARIAAGVAAIRRHAERDRAEMDRLVQTIRPLYDREITPSVRLLLGPIIGDLRSVLGAMVPPSTAEPRRDAGGRSAGR